MYRLSIPKDKTSVISILDSLVVNKSVDISDAKICRHVGGYLKPWRQMGFISLYVEPKQKRTILVSNVNIYKNPRFQNNIEFFIDDSILKPFSFKNIRL